MDASKSAIPDLEKSKVTRLRPTKPCPICKKDSKQKFYPFCTARCANIDLNRWLTGAYAIPVSEEEAQDERDEFSQS